MRFSGCSENGGSAIFPTAGAFIGNYDKEQVATVEGKGMRYKVVRILGVIDKMLWMEGKRKTDEMAFFHH